jgi:hypothetical protein
MSVASNCQIMPLEVGEAEALQIALLGVSTGEHPLTLVRGVGGARVCEQPAVRAVRRGAAGPNDRHRDDVSGAADREGLCVFDGRGRVRIGQHTAAVKTARLVSALSMLWLRSDTIGWLTAATREMFTAAFVSAIVAWPQQRLRKWA